MGGDLCFWAKSKGGGCENVLKRWKVCEKFGKNARKSLIKYVQSGEEEEEKVRFSGCRVKSGISAARRESSLRCEELLCGLGVVFWVNFGEIRGFWLKCEKKRYFCGLGASYS